VRQNLFHLHKSTADDWRRFLNIKLDDIKVLDEERHPHMVSRRWLLLGESAV
jgi:hypothetical protein